MRDMEVELQESWMNVLRGMSTEELEDYVNRTSEEVELFLARKTRDLEEVKKILEEKNGQSK